MKLSTPLPEARDKAMGPGSEPQTWAGFGVPGNRLFYGIDPDWIDPIRNGRFNLRTPEAGS